MRLRWLFLAIAVVAQPACRESAPPRDSGTGAAPATPARADPEPIALNADLSYCLRLIEQHRTDEARAALAIYAEKRPDDGQAAFLRGLSYHREKRYGQAREHFERAIDLSPGYHPAYHFLGWSLYYLGEPDASARAFEKHLSYMPEEGDSHFALGLIALDRDDLDEAEARFTEAIRLQAGRRDRLDGVSKAHARLADLYIRRDRLEEAREHLERATELWPEHYTAFYKLSRVLTRMGETEKAEKAFELYRVYQERAEIRRGIPGSAS